MMANDMHSSQQHTHSAMRAAAPAYRRVHRACMSYGAMHAAPVPAATCNRSPAAAGAFYLGGFWERTI